MIHRSGSWLKLLRIGAEKELPSQPNANPWEHVMAITLRSGTQLNEPTMIKKTKNDKKAIEEKKEKDKEVSREASLDKATTIRPIETILIPLVPFPQRLKKDKDDTEFHKFINNFKNLYINIPFANTILQIPSYHVSRKAS